MKTLHPRLFPRRLLQKYVRVGYQLLAASVAFEVHSFASFPPSPSPPSCGKFQLMVNRGTALNQVRHRLHSEGARGI